MDTQISDDELAELLADFNAEAPRALEPPADVFTEIADEVAAATLRNNWTEVYNNRLPYPLKESREESRASIERIYQDTRDGPVSVTYRRPSGAATGRLIAAGQAYRAQGQYRTIRQTLFGPRYVDIDLENCHPTISLVLADAFGVDVPTLRSYVADRSAFLASTGASKPEVLAMITGGGRSKPLTGRLALLRAELAALRAAIAAAPEYAEERRTAKAGWWRKQSTGDTFENVEGCTIALVLQRIEDELLSTVRRVIVAAGGRIGSLHYDGLQAERDSVDLPRLLPAIEVALAAAGYPLRAVEKPPTEAIDLTGLSPEGNGEERIADVTPGDEFDRVLSAETVGGPLVYNSEAIGDDGVSDLYVQSSWATGKSVHIRQIIEAQQQADPTAVIILVVARKSLTAQVEADLRGVGLVTYSDIKGQLNTDQHPVTLWQLEALGRVPAGTKCATLVIDEVAQLTAHAFCGADKSEYLTRIKLLARSAGRLIVCDNDLTENHVTAFKALRGDHAARVVHNAFQPWAGVPVQIVSERFAESSVFKSLCETLERYAAAKAAGASYGTVVTAYHSRAKLERDKLYLEKAYPGIKIKAYTSETDDKTKRADFSNALAAWAGDDRPDLIQYTATVSVGVSCASPLVTDCFAFFSSGNAPTTQSAQMLFRCRNLRCVTISYQQGPPPLNGPPKNLAGLCRWLILARNQHEIPAQLRHDRCGAAGDVWGNTATNAVALANALSSSFEGRLFAGDALERHRSAIDFVDRLRTVLERAGLAVEVDSVDKGDREPLPGAVFKAGAEASAARAAVVAANTAAAAEDAQTRAEHGDAEESRGDQTREQKLGAVGYWLSKALGVLGKPVTGEWVAAFEPLKEGYERSRRYISGEAAYRLATGPATSGEAEAARYRTRVGAALGVAVAVDTPVSFAVDRVTLATNPAIEPLVRDINLHGYRVFGGAGGKRREKREAKPSAVVAALREVVGWYGGEITAQYASARDRKQGRVRDYEITWGWRSTALPGPAPAAF